jgi:hypothetical protein
MRCALCFHQIHILSPLSTGAFGYPPAVGCSNRIAAIFDFLRTEKRSLELVRIVLHSYDNRAAYPTYEAALKRLLGG